MKAPIKTTQALTAWVNETRQHAPLLDDDADALLARLSAISAQETALIQATDFRKRSRNRHGT